MQNCGRENLKDKVIGGKIINRRAITTEENCFQGYLKIAIFQRLFPGKAKINHLHF